MTLYSYSALLAMGPPPNSQAPAWTGLVMPVMLLVVFYVVLIRPQQKKANDHADMLKTLKSGDRVVTSGGIVGVIVTVKDKHATIRSADTKLEVLKSAITEIVKETASNEA